jgi:hypothetical protein
MFIVLLAARSGKVYVVFGTVQVSIVIVDGGRVVDIWDESIRGIVALMSLHIACSESL